MSFTTEAEFSPILYKKMIKDQQVLEAIRESWRTVRIMEAMINTNMNAHIHSLVPHITGFSKVPESLLLLFGVSVLEDALKQLKKEKAFSCSGNLLGAMMDGSKNSLPWQNYDQVFHIKKRRNEVAHDHQFLEIGQCNKYLNTIASELIAWGILKNDYTESYTVSLG